LPSIKTHTHTHTETNVHTMELYYAVAPYACTSSEFNIKLYASNAYTSLITFSTTNALDSMH